MKKIFCVLTMLLITFCLSSCNSFRLIIYDGASTDQTNEEVTDDASKEEQTSESQQTTEEQTSESQQTTEEQTATDEESSTEEPDVSTKVSYYLDDVLISEDSFKDSYTLKEVTYEGLKIDTWFIGDFIYHAGDVIEANETSNLTLKMFIDDVNNSYHTYSFDDETKEAKILTSNFGSDAGDLNKLRIFPYAVKKDDVLYKVTQVNLGGYENFSTYIGVLIWKNTVVNYDAVFGYQYHLNIFTDGEDLSIYGAMLSEQILLYNCCGGLKLDETGLLYYLKSDTRTISILSDFDHASQSELIVPTTLDGFEVTEIMDQAFVNCKFESYKIPASINKIGQWAFNNTVKSFVVDPLNQTFDSRDNCNAIIETKTDTLVFGAILTKIPASVKKIGNLAFANINAIETVVIPEGVTDIGEAAFIACSSMTSLTLPDSLTTISTNAFFGCSMLQSVTIPKNVSNLGLFTFGDCMNLETLVVDPLNETFDSRDNCNAIIKTSTNELVFGIKTTVIPNTVETLGSYAFANSHLTKITIPVSVLLIGEGCFVASKNLEEVVLPNELQAIDNGAFSGCSNLRTIDIPISVYFVGDYVFYGCDNAAIGCEAPSRPESWSQHWLGSTALVIWGHKIKNN